MTLELIGKYKIISELARGGMGIVFKAEDPNLKRIVAIKQLSIAEPDEERNEEFRERFRREAILVAKLSHPNIVAIFDVCIDETMAYYVMEFMKGKTLTKELEKRPGNKMSVEEFWPIFSQVCQGLSYACSMNLVHRDIKPDNIFLLADGTAKITDFGIARSKDNQQFSRLTKPGSFLGTLAYVSPEQLQDPSKVDHRADIYSLAAMTYESLCGQLPFSGDGLHSMMTAIVAKEETPLNQIDPEISSHVAAVISRALRKKPEDRYASFDEFEREFEKAMNAPKASKRLIPATGRSTGSFSTSPAQNASSNSAAAETRAPAQGSAPAEELKPWKRAPARFFALTKSTPLVKPLAQFSVTNGAGLSKSEPAAICARKGKVYVADNASKKIKIYDKMGKLEGETRCAPSNKALSKTNGGEFLKATGITIDVLGKIYLTDSNDQFIRVFDANAWFLREFTNKEARSGGLNGLLIDDRKGCLYLADPSNNCVQYVTSDLGSPVHKLEHPAILQNPVRMSVDGFGQIYVLDQESCKVSIFSSNGSFQRSWGNKGSAKSELNMPSGMAIDQADRLYIACPLDNRVLTFSSAGDYLFVFGGFGSGPGQFNNPEDLCVDLENNLLYVLDKGNRRVQIYEIIMEEEK